MPEPEAPNRGIEATLRNLPVPVPRPSEIARTTPGDNWFARALRSLFGWKTGSIRADLETVLGAGSAAETGFSPIESTMLKNILGLRERRIDDVMVPRADIVAVQQDIILGDLIKTFEGAPHSRLVVYGETLDDPVGMVHIRDLLAFMTKRAAAEPTTKTRRRKPRPAGLDFANVDLALPLSAAKIVRALLFVPPSMPAIDLLAKMQATRIHLALVIDEYGGTDGLISLEDIVEQVVGDIEDEHDETGIHTVVRQWDGSFLADGRASLEDVVTSIDKEFDVGDAAEEVDTIGGYVVTRVGRVPVRGELVPGPGPFEFEVLDADPRRIKKIRIYRSRPTPAATPRRRDAETAPSGAATNPEPQAESPAKSDATAKESDAP